ncbi:hypothetical protein [Ruminococcus sp.]|uniref:hypothetical protein n=1 Tax=Ruminococcus sp. TaxID=41978 RepID=UPI0038900070
MDIPKNFIEKDELTEVARKAESLSTLLGDIEQDYFEATDPDTILNDYKRLRRYISICFQLSHTLTAELHENGIWCFDRKAVA